MNKHYLMILFGVLALAITSCNGSKGGNKKQGKANPCKTEKVANPCGETAKVTTPGKTTKVANPCGETTKMANPCGETAKKDEAMKKGSEKTTVSTKKGKKLFRANGCTGCHDAKSGMETKPFPSLPHMASLSDSEFKKCILEGVKGTAMVPFKGRVSEDDVKAIHHYIATFKGK